MVLPMPKTQVNVVTISDRTLVSEGPALVSEGPAHPVSSSRRSAASVIDRMLALKRPDARAETTGCWLAASGHTDMVMHRGNAK